MIRENENIQVVEKVFKDLSEGKLEAVMTSFAEAPTWRYPEGSPFKTLYEGLNGVQEYLHDVKKVYPAGRHIADLTLHGDRDRVFAEYRFTATSNHGKKVEEHALAVFELVFGKITSVREYNTGHERSVLGSHK